MMRIVIGALLLGVVLSLATAAAAGWWDDYDPFVKRDVCATETFVVPNPANPRAKSTLKLTIYEPCDVGDQSCGTVYGQTFCIVVTEPAEPAK